MPAYAHREGKGRNWTPRADFMRPTGVTHVTPSPTSIEHLTDILDDMSVSPDAEIQRDVDDALVREIYRGIAKEIFPHVRADGPKQVTIEDALARRELQQLGTTALGGNELR